jgi:hypothetical protein
MKQFGQENPRLATAEGIAAALGEALQERVEWWG